MPQFFYLNNDAAAYDAGERQLLYRYLSRRMQPDRWAFCQQVYQQCPTASLIHSKHKCRFHCVLKPGSARFEQALQARYGT